MTTIAAVGYKSGMIIATDSQTNKKKISTGRVIERSFGHQKIFPLSNLPMIVVESGMEMTDIASPATRLNAIQQSIRLSLKNARDISELFPAKIEEIFTQHTVSAYQTFCLRLPAIYEKRLQSAIFFSDEKRKNCYVWLEFPEYRVKVGIELSLMIMGHVHADPRMQKLKQKLTKHFSERKRRDATKVAKALVNKGIEIDEDSGGNIQMMELTPKGWKWLAKP